MNRDMASQVNVCHVVVKLSLFDVLSAYGYKSSHVLVEMGLKNSVDHPIVTFPVVEDR
jgi:hypothetical protein